MNGDIQPQRGSARSWYDPARIAQTRCPGFRLADRSGMRSIRRPRSRSPASAALIDVWADLRINLQAKVRLYVGQRASTAHEKGTARHGHVG
jgi:hypothetical protein